jgi:hypothetical protein
MSCGYDPFKWADTYKSEEEYLKDLEEENMGNKIEIDLDAITQRRDELMDLKARYSFELKQVEKEMETLDLQLIALLEQTGTDEMQYGTYKFGWVVKSRTALDQKYLKEHYADIAAQCTFTKESKNFDFKINK